VPRPGWILRGQRADRLCPEAAAPAGAAAGDGPWPAASHRHRPYRAERGFESRFATSSPSAGRVGHGGVGAAFALFVLSDTNDHAAAVPEAKAIASFQANDPTPGRIHYRRRRENIGFKAGNVMDFLEHHADGYELMLILDADSEMTPEAVLRLVTAMRDDPCLGIIQHLTVGLPASSAFPRLFQFGMRAGMRIWATALSWWQGDACVYWGHNAVIRIAPFRNHCKLPLLPNGEPILSTIRSRRRCCAVPVGRSAC